MSDKDTNAKSDTMTDSADAPRASTLSIAPMDLSIDAVTVPPPPTSGAAGPGSLSIPRAPRVPQESKPAKKKRSEDDIFSIFDVETNTASDDIPISVQFDKKPEPAPEKPKSQLGSRSEEREITRSRQIPVDEDLFNLSVGLFSTPDRSPLVAPDMSALVGPGLSDKTSSKAASTSALDDIALLSAAAAAPLAPLEPKALAAPVKAATDAPKPTSTGPNRKGIVLGAIAAVLVIGGVFFFMQKSSTPTEPTASATPASTSTEAALDTRPGQTPEAVEPRVAKTESPEDKPAVADKPASVTAADSTPKDSSDKPAKVADSDKQAAQSKPSEPETKDKPAEPEQPAGPSKAKSLAEAMAAATAGGAPATPPPTGGSEFNKSAASSALNAAAGAAAGCKAPGDPSGVARVSVTFAPSGRATRALVNGPPFSGTATGGCIANAFKRASVPPFDGGPVTVSKSVTIR